MSEELKALDIPEEQDLQHYGVSVLEGAPGVGSGRYPLGSGHDAYERQRNFRTTVSALRKAGMSDTDIARHLQLKNTSELRSRISKDKEAVHAYEVAFAKKLKAKGMSNVAIAKRMFNDEGKESTVRNLLKEGNVRKDRIFAETMEALQKELEVHPYLDVGPGTALYLNVSDTRLKNVLTEMKKNGYAVRDIQVQQYGSDDPTKKTTVSVLTKEENSTRDVYQHMSEIVPPAVYLDERTDTIRPVEPPRSIDSKRIYIRYAEEDGTAKDGVIELRRGVEELSLGGAHYAQVRIAVDDSHYLKGMALYSDSIPEGYDVVFNTNKHEGTPMLGEKDNSVLKPLQRTKDGSIDIANPFGAAIKTEADLDLANESNGDEAPMPRQRHYIGADGKEHLSAINIVNEEGAWSKWSRDISAQMLSKQPPALAKQQLDLTYALKKEELNDILSLTNPTIKKRLLEEFANQCDSDAVHLKAIGFPGQIAKVILPVNELKDTECYCPTFDNGTQVVLIRYPHAGRFEIPMLTVNNNNKAAIDILGKNPLDCIGINSTNAAHLSGADFDGDTVYVIPNPHGDIRTMDILAELKDFEPKEAYRGYPGMKKISKAYKNKQMGIVTNLITDMTVAGAPWEDIAKAVKHSMVIIDSEKHGLDWKRSEKENDILELKKKYQMKPDGTFGGSTTLISQAKSEQRVEKRTFTGSYDKETGEPIYKFPHLLDADGKAIRSTLSQLSEARKRVVTEAPELDKTGKPRQTVSTKMAEASDARTLISKYNTQIENVYARFANQMKELARQARYEMVRTPNLKYDPEAHDIYADEVRSLTDKLRAAERNKPLERQALILANVKVKQDVYDDPSIKEDKDKYKKLKGRTLQRMRERVGAIKKRVFFTENEWKAVQAGAVSDSFLKRLLDNSSDDHVKALSMPRESTSLSSAKQSRVRQMLGNGYTQAEVAKMLDISVSQVQGIAKEMR